MRPEVVQALQALATGGARRAALEEQQRQAALAQLATQTGQRTMPAPPPAGDPWAAPEGQEQPGWIAKAAASAAGGGFNAVMGLADLLNRPGAFLRAGFTGRFGLAAKALNPLTLGKLYGEDEVSGRDVLRDLGLARQKDTWGNFAAGMGLELVTDPLNFVTTGFGPGVLTSHLTETGDVARAVAGSKKSAARALQKAETARRSAAASGSLAKMAAARKQAEKAGKRYIQPGSGLGEQLRRQGYPITEPLDAAGIEALAQARPELAALMPTLGEQARAGQRSALYFDPPFPMNLIPGMPPRQTLVRGERTLEALSKSGRTLRRLPGVRNITDQLWARGVSGGPEISRDLIQIAQQAAAESAEEMTQHTPLFRSMFRRVAKAAGEEPTLGGMTPEQIARTDQATRQVLEREALVRLMEVDRALETGLRGTVDTARMPIELKRTSPTVQGSAGTVALKFSRDVDRALYVSTQPHLDEAAGARLWLSEQLPGLDDALIDQVAWGVHTQVTERLRELAPTMRELSIPALKGLEEPVTAELKALAGELAQIDRIRPKYRYKSGTSVTEQLRGASTQAEDPADVAARAAGRKTAKQTFAGGTLEQAEMFAGRESELGVPLVERLRRRLGEVVERAKREQAELTGTGGPGVERPRAQLEERFVAQQVAAGVPEEQARAYAETLSDRRLQDLYGAELRRGELPDEGGMWQRGGERTLRRETLIKRAVKEFGVTDDPRNAGYMLPDGQMLDFSGGWGQGRVRDHREVGLVFDDDKPYRVRGELPNNQGTGTYGMQEFMDRTGAMRLQVWNKYLGMELAEVPTDDQVWRIRDLIKQHKPEEITIDYSGRGRTESLTLEGEDILYDEPLDIARRIREWYQEQAAKPAQERLWQRGAEEGEIPPPWFSAFWRAWEQLPDNMKVDSVIPWLKKRGVKDAELEFMKVPETVHEYREWGLDRVKKIEFEHWLEQRGRGRELPIQEVHTQQTRKIAARPPMQPVVSAERVAAYRRQVEELVAERKRLWADTTQQVLRFRNINEQTEILEAQRNLQAEYYRLKLTQLKMDFTQEVYKGLRRGVTPEMRARWGVPDGHPQINWDDVEIDLQTADGSVAGGGGDDTIYEIWQHLVLRGGREGEAPIGVEGRLRVADGPPDMEEAGGPKYGSWRTIPTAAPEQGGSETYGEVLFAFSDEVGGAHYNDPHWNVPGGSVAAHARYVETDLPDGRRVFIVDEIQSDLHQRGGQQGADMPWRKDWEGRGWRRMFREAAARGDEYVAWPTGLHQSKRYSLREQGVELLEYDKAGQKLKIGNRDGIIREHEVVESALPEWVGAEQAKKLLTGEKLEGADLDVPSVGMSKAYDERAVNIAKKISKEYKLGEVEAIEIRGKVAANGKDELLKYHAVRIPEEARARLMRMEQPLWQEGRTPGREIETPEFRRWFGNSAVTDEETGQPLIVYRGDYRAERVGDRMRKGRSTSSTGFYWTDDPEIASGYAKGKVDAGAVGDAENYGEWFRLRLGPKKGDEVPLDRAWGRLTAEQRQAVERAVREVGMDDMAEHIVREGKSVAGPGHLEWVAREKRGNWLAVAQDIWLDSGNLFDREEQFLDVLRHAGLRAVYDSPHEAHSAVRAVYLSMQNPLRTDQLPADFVARMRAMAGRRGRPTQGEVLGDTWHKDNRTIHEWLDIVEKEIGKKGTNLGDSFVWSSLPDRVEKALKALGYDGIIDTGGKGGGPKHRVYITFDPAQSKSATGNRGTWDPRAASMIRQMPAGGAPKGSFEVTPEGQEIITLFKQGDISSVIHESAHLFRRHLEADELQVLEGWAGVQGGAWTEAAEEKLARAWERYLADGAAPNSALAEIFQKIKRWMIEIYQGITGSEIDVEVSPEVRRVFEGWIRQDQAADIGALETTLKPYTRIKEVALKHLTTDPARFQPRLGLDEAHARSIAEAWDPEQLDPLDVWPNPEKPGEFIVLSGHHRYAAAHMAKAQKVPVRIREVSEQVAKEISIRGNAGRLEMSPLEWGRIFARHHVEGETLAQIRKRYPQFRTNAAVQEHMDLMFLDPVLQDAMHRGQLPKPHGVRIAYAARKWDLTPEIQRRVWETSQERGWSVSKLKEVLEQYGPKIEAEQGLLFDFGDFAQAYERAKKLAGPLDAEIELREKQLKLLADAKKRLAKEGSERALSDTQQAIETAAQRELTELTEFKRRLEALEKGEAVEPLEQLPEWVRAQLGEDSGVMQALSGVGEPENAAELAAAAARRAEIEARQEHLARLLGARVREGVSGPPRMADEDYTRLLREKAELMDRLELGPQELRSARRGTLDYAEARQVAREALGPEQADLADLLAEAAGSEDAGARSAWDALRKLVAPGADRMLDEIEEVAQRIRQGGLTKNQIRAANREITELLEGNRIPQYARPESVSAARQIRKAYEAMLATEMEAGVAVKPYHGSGYTMHVWNPQERGWLRHQTEQEQAGFWSAFWEHLSDRGLLPERQWVEEHLQLVHPGAMQAYTQTVGWDDAQVRTILMGLSPKAQDALVQHRLLEPFTRMLVDIGRPGPATLHRKSAFYGVRVKDINDAWRAAGGGEVMLEDPALQLGHRMLSHLQTMTWVRMRNMMLEEYGRPIPGKINLKEIKGLDIDPATGWKIMPDGQLWPTEINQELMRAGQRPVVFEADVALELSKAIQKLRSPEEIGPLGRWVDWIMRKWKESVTLWFPAFHVRNWISDSFNQWVDGVNPWEWQRMALRVLSGDKDATLTTAAGEVLDFDALKSELFQSSSRLGGWWGTDMVGILQEAVEAAAGYAEKGTTRSWGDWVNPWSRKNPLKRGMEKLGTATEVVVRSASYLNYRQRGMTPEQAMERVQEVLFDYSKTGSTAFESTYARRLIPFWVWEKNNLARQFELLFTQPRAIGTTMRLTGMTEASRDDGGELPPWMMEAPRYGLPSTQEGLRNYVLTLGLPYEDLQKFSGEWPQRPMQRMASNLNPLIKYPMELATGKDLFLGRDISEYRNAPGGAHLVPEGLRGLLGIEQRELPSGRTKLEMDPYAAHALRNLALGRVQSTLGAIVEDPLAGALRTFTGVKQYTVDVEDQRSARSARQLRGVEEEAVRRGAARVFPAVYVPKDKAETPEGEAVKRTLGDLRKLVRTQRKLRAEQQEAASD